jgi:hypothetical protein
VLAGSGLATLCTKPNCNAALLIAATHSLSDLPQCAAAENMLAAEVPFRETSPRPVPLTQICGDWMGNLAPQDVKGNPPVKFLHIKVDYTWQDMKGRLPVLLWLARQPPTPLTVLRCGRRSG